MSKFNVGDKVMMMDEFHASNPEIFPPKGTIGVVVKYSSCDETVLVNWGKGSGVKPSAKNEYTWWCSVYRLEKVSANAQEEDVNMSKFNVGDKVVFINGDKHKRLSQFYPAVGSVGIIKNKDKDDGDVLVDWGEAEGVNTNGNYAAKKAWWCEEEDIKLCEYTDNEVWEMLKPKMRQFVPARIEDIDMFSPAVKNMVVAAYRSGYGRATKGRSFMIKPKVDEKPNIEKSIDNVLSGKMIVTIYTDLNDSYLVSKFNHALYSKQGMEIHGNVIYNSDGGTWADGFDVIDDSDCEMYVAISFNEVMGWFESDSIKVLYCGNNYNLKPWAIGEFDEFFLFGDETRAFMTFKHEDSNSKFCPEIRNLEFKALVPICDYLRVHGVNV